MVGNRADQGKLKHLGLLGLEKKGGGGVDPNLGREGRWRLEKDNSHWLPGNRTRGEMLRGGKEKQTGDGDRLSGSQRGLDELPREETLHHGRTLG